jgi:hypothetical protein
MSGRSLNFNNVGMSLRQCLRQCVSSYSSSGSEDGDPLPNIGDVRNLPEHGLHLKSTADKRSVAEEKKLAEKYGLTLLDVGEVDMERPGDGPGKEDLELVELDGVEESPSEEKISTAPERDLSFLNRCGPCK